MNEHLKNELRKDLPEDEGTPVGEGTPVAISAAESIMFGIDPAMEEARDAAKDELSRNPEDWSPEERERVEAIMKTLTPPAPQPMIDLRKHFTPGQTFRDTAGIRMVVRTVGTAAINISVLGKNGRFVDGHGVTLAGFLFVTSRSKKRDTTLQLKGIQQQVEVDGDPD